MYNKANLGLLAFAGLCVVLAFAYPSSTADTRTVMSAVVQQCNACVNNHGVYDPDANYDGDCRINRDDNCICIFDDNCPSPPTEIRQDSPQIPEQPLIVPADPDYDNPGCRVYTNFNTQFNGINVRSQPALDADKLGVFSHTGSAEFIAFSPDDQWVKIRLKLDDNRYQIGWVSKDLLRLFSQPNGAYSVLLGDGCDVCTNLRQTATTLLPIISSLCPRPENGFQSQLTATFVLIDPGVNRGDVFMLIDGRIRRLTETQIIDEKSPVFLPEYNLIAYIAQDLDGTTSLVFHPVNLEISSNLTEEPSGTGEVRRTVLSDVVQAASKLLWINNHLYFTDQNHQLIEAEIIANGTEISFATTNIITQDAMNPGVSTVNGRNIYVVQDAVVESGGGITFINARGEPQSRFGNSGFACRFPVFTEFDNKTAIIALCDTGMFGFQIGNQIETWLVEMSSNPSNLNGNLHNGYLSYDDEGKLFWVDVQNLFLNSSTKSVIYPMTLSKNWDIHEFNPVLNTAN